MVEDDGFLIYLDLTIKLGRILYVLSVQPSNQMLGILAGCCTVRLMKLVLRVFDS